MWWCWSRRTHHFALAGEEDEVPGRRCQRWRGGMGDGVGYLMAMVVVVADESLCGGAHE